MSTCFDVYVLASGCDVIYAYPSAKHPPSGSVRPSGPVVGRKVGVPPPRDPRHADDEALILLLYAFTTQ